MTLSLVPAPTDGPRDDEHRDFAVVEIRRDGTLGRPQLVTAAGPLEAVRVSSSPGRRGTAGNPVLTSQLGLLLAAEGPRSEGSLALTMAMRGELRGAREHAARTLGSEGAREVAGVLHAHLALAWIHLERGELDRCWRLLDLMRPDLDDRPDPWLATVGCLIEARALVAVQRPDSAIRLLTAATAELARTPWACGMMAVARADALLAAGEPHRALAAVTPAPPEVAAAASVVSAAARQAVGDVRGAVAVLRSVTETLESAPLDLQVRAWLLEARLADTHDSQHRSTSLANRALSTAAADELRLPVLREWGWLRTLVERDMTLLRTHHEFLVGVRRLHLAQVKSQTAMYAGQSSTVDLTEREAQVLELLAQMLTTEEIAERLYLSVNTVKSHVKRIFAKLEVHRRADAVRRGRHLGLC
ncbi:LuxR family transcriptional regulator [Nocardioides sp. W7]|uniref:LuxR family transcriptional regulator n=1 Tax=Nocardioides sp. W7 TaxID=2931390 RepID=UPI001FD15ACF|nr:LuxR family transcriptional regulator [Nocardioides sp. W7]